MTIRLERFLVPVVLLLAVCLLPQGVQAHGEGVLPFTATTTEGYIIDVDYGGLKIESDVSGTFTFNLFKDAARTEEAVFKDLWVRIVEEDGSEHGRTIFAGPIARPVFGQLSFLYVFQHAGKYSLVVRYNQEETGSIYDQKKIEATFPLEVYPRAATGWFSVSSEFLMGGAAGALSVLLLGLLMHVIRRKRSGKRAL
ncbi:MAG: hypothetical protein AB199_01820 [Parcubacteria bacterium C7867-004]|nr:MAG: hypothetical protein AB199_01820 [Parcubacteria bacterium C7867-004]